MPSIFAPNWLSRQPLEISLQHFLASLPAGAKIIDVGCGHKPYAGMMKKFEYIGVDSSPQSAADIVCSSNNIPLPTDTFDAVMCTQTLQHVEDPAGTLKEIHRLMKSNGHFLLTVPFATKIVAEPKGDERADYWRYTEYGLRRLMAASGFEIQSIKPLTGYSGTLAGSRNYFLASLNIPLLFIPFYFFNNITGWLIDAFASTLLKLLPFPKVIKWYRHIYQSFPLGYIVVARKVAIDKI